MLAKPEHVLTLHGLAAPKIVMWPIGIALRREGYAVTNWGYPSIVGSIESHAQRLTRRIQTLCADHNVQRLHVIAHSMGGIVLRQALLQWHCPVLERIVLLASPNGGSHVATKLSKTLGRFSRTLCQISDEEGSFVRTLPPTLCERYEVGLIRAGGDLVVAPDAVLLPDARDVAIVPGMHSAILWKPETAELCASFLRNGKFSERKLVVDSELAH